MASSRPAQDSNKCLDEPNRDAKQGTTSFCRRLTVLKGIDEGKNTEVLKSNKNTVK